jgi:hypothetical protein
VEVVTLADGMCEKTCENSSAKISFWPLHEKNHTGANGKTQPLSLCRFSFIFNLLVIFSLYIQSGYVHWGYLIFKFKKHEDSTVTINR